MRYYAIQVDIFEAATRYAYPVVRHQFLGKDRAEAMRYHDSHRQSDRFIRECEDMGMFQGDVPCRAVITEGWTEL